MPIWRGLNGEYFRFSLGGYQFPDICDDYDANWLFLNIEAKNEQGVWKQRCPCILTWEVAWYAKWLKNVTWGNCYDQELSVLEGDFELIYIAEAQGLQRFMVCLEYGLAYEKPKEGKRDKSVIGVCLTKLEVEESIAYFEEMFAAFPPRGEQGKRSYESLPGPKIFCDG